MWLTLILTALTTVDGPGFAVSAAVAPSETLSEAAAGCTSNFDCGGDNGNCDEDKGVCKCRKPWYGVECSSLALAPASKSNGYVRNLGRACLSPYSSRFRHSFLTLTPKKEDGVSLTLTPKETDRVSLTLPQRKKEDNLTLTLNPRL